LNGKEDVFTDSRDGQQYKAVKIGNQIWMAENLNYAVSGSWCYYNENSNCKKYGRLYNWDDAIKACPPGWHLPTDVEWKNLEMALGMPQTEVDKTEVRGTDQGTQLKVGGSSGFRALLSGYRNSDGSFYYLDANARFWSSSQFDVADAWSRIIHAGITRVYRGNKDKSLGFCVRCIRD
jgi:uncharacterized protein (TIGR02145 family)